MGLLRVLKWRGGELFPGLSWRRLMVMSVVLDEGVLVVSVGSVLISLGVLGILLP